MSANTCLLTIRGDTRPCKEVLKRAGWRWNPTANHWYLRLTESHAARVRAKDRDFCANLKIYRPGCEVMLDGLVMWTSKTFRLAGSADDDEYNCDGHGNYIAAKCIPGSAPDDRI